MSFGIGSIGEPGEGAETKNASKNVKVMKETQKMYKEARMSEPAIRDTVSSFEGMGTVLAVLKPILDAMQPVIEVIGSLFSALSGAFMAELMPAIKPIIDVLLELMPHFMALGTILAQAITPIIETLGSIFIDMQPVIESLLGLIGPLVTLAFVPLEAVLTILAPLLDDLAPVFDLIADALDILEPIITTIAGIFSDILVGAIKIAALAIAYFIDAITLGLAGAVNYVTKLFNELEGIGGEETTYVPAGRPSYEELYGQESNIGFQTGTPLITRTGNVRVHAGESIQRADLVGLSEELLMELIVETRKAREDKKFRNAFKRRY